MRPRFSIRLLLISVSIIAFACYVCFVRPIALAKQFKQAIGAKDFIKAESLCMKQQNHFLSECMDGGRTYHVEVEVYHRRWQDVWKLRQPMLVRVIPDEPRPGSKTLVGLQVDVIATAAGIKSGGLYPVTFER